MPADVARPDIRFAIVPEWLIFGKELSDGAFRQYAAISRYVGADLTAFPARSTLAKLMGVSTKTVDRRNDELVEFGAIQKIKRYSDSGDPTSNLYVVRRVPPGTVLDVETAASIGSDTRDATPSDSGDAIDNPTDVPRTIPPTNDTTTNGDGVAIKWAKRWCEVMGMAPTKHVLKKFGPMALEYVQTTGREPTEQLLQMAKQQGINTPAGWAFVRGAAPETERKLADCDKCGNRRRLGYDAGNNRVPYDSPKAVAYEPCDCIVHPQ